MDSRPDILTASGRYFNFLALENNVFDITEIAHALSNICRFTGHANEFYSVAQHCVMVSHLVPPEDALAGLLHDAAEAFLGDVSRPLKQLLPDYKAIEKLVEADVFRRFGLPSTLPASVKQADLVMLATEQRDLMPPHDDEWPVISHVTPLVETLMPWDNISAKAAFLRRYCQLTA